MTEAPPTSPARRGRPRGTVETAPRKAGCGRKRAKTYAQIHAADPDGVTEIKLRLPNHLLARMESAGIARELTTQGEIRTILTRLEIESRMI